jgi:hypothetical protein
MVGGGVQLGPLSVRRPPNSPIVPIPGDYDDGEFDGIMIGGRKPKYSEKTCAVPVCPPQMPHNLTE